MRSGDTPAGVRPASPAETNFEATIKISRVTIAQGLRPGRLSKVRMKSIDDRRAAWQTPRTAPLIPGRETLRKRVDHFACGSFILGPFKRPENGPLFTIDARMLVHVEFAMGVPNACTPMQ
jgi:hypothetical protein